MLQLYVNARVAKLADARDLKSRVSKETYRFNSGPGHHLALICTSEDPSFTDLRVGNAHLIRNVGGRAGDDAIQSLVISDSLACDRMVFLLTISGKAERPVHDFHEVSPFAENDPPRPCHSKILARFRI